MRVGAGLAVTLHEVAKDSCPAAIVWASDLGRRLTEHVQVLEATPRVEQDDALGGVYVAGLKQLVSAANVAAPSGHGKMPSAEAISGTAARASSSVTVRAVPSLSRRQRRMR